MKTQTIIYPSSDEQSQISARLFIPDEVPLRAVMQISHGMCEHMGRYEDVAYWFCQRGIAVCGNDHLGHGQTALINQSQMGYFGPWGSGRFLVEDLERLRLEVENRFPGFPYFLLGHSMGSFIARLYGAKYGRALAGLIISGTSGINPAASLGRLLARSIGMVRGPRYISHFLFSQSNGRFAKSIPKAATSVDWVSKDPEICRNYRKDALCSFTFTTSAYYELFGLLNRSNLTSWYSALPRELPVLLFSGDKDPVGANGKGPRQVYQKLLGAGMKHVWLNLYPNGRHEMLNETNREEVYSDVLVWLEEILQEK